MSILEKAKELGQEIASSVELEQMKAAELAMMTNTETRNLVEEFNTRQRKFMEMKSQGIALSEDQLKEAEDLERRVMENSLMVDFFRKQQDFEQIIEKINSIITSAITGEDSGCSDECCTSCSGC